MIQNHRIAPTPTELRVLQAIVKTQAYTDPVEPTIEQIADTAGMVVSNIYVGLVSLEFKKMITREREPGRKRAKYRGAIRITERGNSVLQAAARRRA